MGVLLFDLDGTLIDSGDDLADAVNVTLGHLGLPLLDRDLIISYVGDGVQMLIRRSLEGSQDGSQDGATTSEIDHALGIFLDHYRANCTVKTALYPGVVETLGTLSKDHTLAVVTNKGEELARLILEQLGALHFFAEVVGGNTLSVRKPDPQVIDHLVTTLQSPKSTMVMIGDHHTDLATGDAAGIPTVFCTFGLGHTRGLSPTATIQAFPELIEVVPSLLT